MPIENYRLKETFCIKQRNMEIKPTSYKNYSVTRDGNIISSHSGEYLTKTKVGGYHSSTLRINGVSVTKSVHRLVALAFIPNPDNLPTVNHKDGNGFNNHVDNLEWATHRQQAVHAHANGLVTLTKRSVCQYTMDYKYMKTFESCKVASEKTGVQRRLISSVCSGKVFSTGGFRWKYEDDPEEFAMPKGGAFRAVQQIDPETDEVIKIFNSIKEASVETGASLTHIGSVCRGKRPLCGGYTWKFVEKEKPKVPIYQNWKEIPGHPKYRVSTKGEIYSIAGKRILKPTLSKGGYYSVSIGGKTTEVHRIVAQCYLPNPDNLPIVNHLNGKEKWNNAVSNLQWDTYSENTLHAYRTGLIKSRAKKVRQLTPKGKDVIIHNDAATAAKSVGLTKEAIYSACSGHSKLCTGYKFEYV